MKASRFGLNVSGGPRFRHVGSIACDEFSPHATQPWH
jgi:hypothetical protein